MKSASNDLISRGYLEENIFIEKSFRMEELIEQLNDPEPVQRSLAARLIGETCLLDNTAAKALLKCLMMEKKLYTRLELCRALEKGNGKTARLMIPYINTIGNNQYESISEAKTSLKKSYPLPRDIICRVIGKMSGEEGIVLLNYLTDKQYSRELIDGLGFLIFYNPSLQREDYFLKGKEAYELFKDDPLYVWKYIIFCSAFPFDYSKRIVTEIERLNPEKIFQTEVERTRRLSRMHQVFL
ncbi:hypothetical protein IW492_12930 [Enterococcus sp. BWB1-3]|uniref:hypothetical protein n=1 Tax=unclassified Enterococcus TaxID=2608891 RepID=UPI0019247B9A|nr:MULTISPECIES: hypothetical protein [unclassified Enterococcus]MBL1230137.1 hypothetical protein [Enterococcus sp. BWB1-3]MCB5950961.1 hypothetical protein [Enterococcus sp. BWT-B8]MCB5955595.1 hypothetical protein [Enterococcus sp. CWB-B31]